MEDIGGGASRSDHVVQTYLRPIGIVLARDPPSRHFGRAFVHFGGFWRGGQSSKTVQNTLKGRVTLKNAFILSYFIIILAPFCLTKPRFQLKSVQLVAQ